MQHQIAGQTSAPRLSARRGGEDIVGALQLVEDVESLEPDRELLDERLRERSIANKVVGVHRCALVATATIHAGIGGKVDIPRQAAIEREAVVEVEDVENGLTCHGITVNEVACHSDFEVRETIAETQ